MPRPSYLAFDLGASSGRAVLGTLDGAKMRMEEVHRFPTPVLEDDGHLVWDLGALWADLQVGLQKALAVAPGLRSLSVDSWAIDYVALGADGAPVRPAYAYRDLRTEGVMERAFETLPPSALYARTGIQFLPFNTLYQLLADQRDDPAGLGRVAAHLLVADFFNYQFSGRQAIERTNASTTQLMNARTGEWDAELFEAFGLDLRQWPEIVAPGTKLGPARLAPEVAVVASCSHDTGSAVAAAPATGDADCAFVSCGTWSLLGAVEPAPILTEAAREAGFTNEAGVDGAIRFLTNLTGLWALQECAREWGVDDWAALEAQAATASAVAPIDLEDPRFLPRGDMEARIHEACRDAGQPEPQTRGEVVRLLLTSLAASYRRALGGLERVTGRSFAALHLFGGGSQNRLLCQLTADACGVRVVAGPAEATALGNLLVQARTMGDLGGLTLRDAARQSSDLHDFHPTPTHGLPD